MCKILIAFPSRSECNQTYCPHYYPILIIFLPPETTEKGLIKPFFDYISDYTFGYTLPQKVPFLRFWDSIELMSHNTNESTEKPQKQAIFAKKKTLDNQCRILRAEKGT